MEHFGPVSQPVVSFTAHRNPSAYETGRGIIHVRGKARVETIKDRDRIIIDELYQVNKAQLVEKRLSARKTTRRCE